MDKDALLAALQHADAAGDTKTAAAIAAELGKLPDFQQVAPADAGLRGTIDPNAQPQSQTPAVTTQTAPVNTQAAPQGISFDDPSASTTQQQPQGIGFDAPADTPASNSTDTTGVAGNGLAALLPFARDMTYGLSSKAEAGLATAMYAPGATADAIANIPAAIMGHGNGAGERYAQYYDAANKAVDQQYDALSNAHPYLNALGHAAGLVGGIRALPALGPSTVAGQPVGNLLRYAANGGINGSIVGAVDQIGRDESLGDAAENTAIGGVLGAGAGAVLGPAVAGAVKLAGPAVSRVAQYVGNKLTGSGAATEAPSVSKAWQYLAHKIGTDPDELAQLLEHNRANGVPTSIAGVVNARDAGIISNLADKNPDLATGLQAGREVAREASPTNMAQAIEQNIPTDRPQFLQSVATGGQSETALANARDRAMDSAMDPIRATPVNMDQDLIDSPTFQANLPAGRKAAELRTRLNSNQASVGDIDLMRKELGKVPVGTPGGKEAAALREDINDVMQQQVPAYNEAMQQYGQASKYIQGFQHGNKGNPADNVPEENDALRGALDTIEGMQGHGAGIYIHARNAALAGADSAVNLAKMLSRNTAGNTLLHAANPTNAFAVNAAANSVASRARAMNLSTPASVKVPEEKGFGGEAAQAGASMAVGSPHGAVHSTFRAIRAALGGSTFSPIAQRQLSIGLNSLDPAVVTQTLNRMRQAGVTNDQIRQIGQRAAAFGGRQASDFLNAGTGQ